MSIYRGTLAKKQLAHARIMLKCSPPTVSSLNILTVKSINATILRLVIVRQQKLRITECCNYHLTCMQPISRIYTCVLYIFKFPTVCLYAVAIKHFNKSLEIYTITILYKDPSKILIIFFQKSHN